MIPLPEAIREAALSDNCSTLQQGERLLSSLDRHSYARKHPFCFDSSIGGHFRHVLDHYFSYLKSLEGGEVDYESRDRDFRLETEPGYALEASVGIRAQLLRLALERLHDPIRFRTEFSPSRERPSWAASSHVRELEFLLSHTIHHFALIGAMCCMAGMALPKDFGVAPSTLRYRLTKDATDPVTAGA